MVFVDIEAGSPELQSKLESLGVIALVGSPHARLATHLDISDDDVDTVIAAFAQALNP